jgi:hypothetical protein
LGRCSQHCLPTRRAAVPCCADRLPEHGPGPQPAAAGGDGRQCAWQVWRCCARDYRSSCKGWCA